MDDPDWKDTLQIVYENQLLWSKDTDFDSDHPVVKESDNEPEQVQKDLAFLHEVGLVGPHHVGFRKDISRPDKSGVAGLPDHDERVGSHLGLTPMGFNVIHERELNQNQTRTNVGIAILTVFLVLGSLLQGYSAYLSQGPVDQVALLLVMVIALIVGISVFGFMIGLTLRELGQEIRDTIGRLI